MVVVVLGVQLSRRATQQRWTARAAIRRGTVGTATATRRSRMRSTVPTVVVMVVAVAQDVVHATRCGGRRIRVCARGTGMMLLLMVTVVRPCTVVQRRRLRARSEFAPGSSGSSAQGHTTANVIGIVVVVCTKDPRLTACTRVVVVGMM